MRIPLVLILSLIAFGVGSQSRAATADDVAAHMHRGLNVLDDDPFWRDPAAARFTPRHFARLAEAGFDTARINLHLFEHMDQAHLAALDRLVKAGLDAGLTIILDMHEDQACARDADACRAKLHAVWSLLASRYRDRPERLLFEILNEPHGALTAPKWNTMLREMLGVIRAADPERNVVVGPAQMSSVGELPTLDLPASDRHIVVTVHYYTPVTFTLQGARWVPDAKDLSNVSWGSDAEIASLVRAFDRVRAWADTARRPIFLGEFGTYEKVPMEGRVRWMSRVARVAEAHGFSWAYWQMDTDFAVYDFERGRWIAPLLKALVP
jgi:endoglucanase